MLACRDLWQGMRLRLYWADGKENGNYCNIIGPIWGGLLESPEGSTAQVFARFLLLVPDAPQHP